MNTLNLKAWEFRTLEVYGTSSGTLECFLDHDDELDPRYDTPSDKQVVINFLQTLLIELKKESSS